MPARPHQVLVVGAGSIGERHVRCFLATGRARVSYVEVRESLRDEVAGRYPGAAPFASLDAALERRVDAAVVATPAPLHVPQAMQLVGRGVHVLIEKPLSVTAAGVGELIEASRSRRIVASVAYVYRAHPVLAEMRDAIRSGRFGRPVELVAVAGQHFPLYRPAYAQTYYAKREFGGGAVQDALTHVINAGEWLVGPIDRVVGDVAHQVLAEVEVEDTAHVLAHHRCDDGGTVLASYSLNQHQAPNEITMTVVCERGTVRFEFHACRWRSLETPGGEWTDHGGVPLERDTLFTRQANAFLDAVEGEAVPLCSLEEGLATLRANVAILKSADERRWQLTAEA
jgi:predicted dehydrogenase